MKTSSFKEWSNDSNNIQVLAKTKSLCVILNSHWAESRQLLVPALHAFPHLMTQMFWIQPNALYYHRRETDGKKVPVHHFWQGTRRVSNWKLEDKHAIIFTMKSINLDYKISKLSICNITKLWDKTTAGIFHKIIVNVKCRV